MIGGIRDPRCSRIRDNGDVRSVSKSIQQNRGSPGLVMVMVTVKPVTDAVMAKQEPRSTRIFRCDQINLLQDTECPQCDVLKVADGCTDKKERSPCR